jgi:hypothetical protein
MVCFINKVLKINLIDQPTKIKQTTMFFTGATIDSNYFINISKLFNFIVKVNKMLRNHCMQSMAINAWLKFNLVGKSF